MTDADSIVMIEDDEGHARLIARNIRRVGVQSPIRHFTDGTSASAYLFDARAPGNAVEPCPSVVFLDLNLPDMSGTDILKRIKEDLLLRRLMVIVLTTTDDKAEINRCYDLGCNAYLTKPLHHQSFAGVLGHLGQFLSITQSPEPARC